MMADALYSAFCCLSSLHMHRLHEDVIRKLCAGILMRLQRLKESIQSDQQSGKKEADDGDISTSSCF